MCVIHLFFLRFAQPLAERVTARVDFLVKTIPSGKAINDKMLSYMEHRKMELKQMAATKQMEKVTPKYMRPSMAPSDSFLERGNGVKRDSLWTTTPNIRYPQVMDNQNKSPWKQQAGYVGDGNQKVLPNNVLPIRNNVLPIQSNVPPIQNNVPLIQNNVPPFQNNEQVPRSSNQDVNVNQINTAKNSQSQVLYFGQGDNLVQRANLNNNNNVQRMGQHKGQYIGQQNNLVPIQSQNNQLKSNSQNIIPVQRTNQTYNAPKTVPIIQVNYAAAEFHRQQEAIMDKLPEMIKMPELAQKQNSQELSNTGNIPNQVSEKGTEAVDSDEGKQSNVFIEDAAKNEVEADNEIPPTESKDNAQSVNAQPVVESNKIQEEEEAPLGKSNLSEVDHPEEIDEPSTK